MWQIGDNIRADIAGPGVTRAMQEAVRAKKSLVLVPQYDNLGRILAVGYFLQDRGRPMPADPEITWLAKNEYHVKKRLDFAGGGVKASLQTKFTAPVRPDERQYMIELLAIGSRHAVLLRTVFRISRAKTTGFVVQAELRDLSQEEVNSRAVVRYDCAHGFLHRDMIPVRGRGYKVPLGDLAGTDAMSFVIDELGSNLVTWLRDLGYEGIDATLLETPEAKEQLQKAKILLLELHDDPSRMPVVESTLHQVKDGMDRVRRIFPPETRG